MTHAIDPRSRAQTTLNTLLAGDDTATLHDFGQGPAVLLLHGGGGPATVLGLAQTLAAKARVLVPTHPGFDGTTRPESLLGIPQLANLYVRLLAALDLRDVLVVGSSIGGWTAAEMARADSSRIAGLVLLNPVGIRVEEAPLTDVRGLTRPELVRLSAHNPERVMAGLAAPTPATMALLAANAAALAAYDNGCAMMDPELRQRLSAVATPAQVLWGQSDGLASPAYGKAYADAFANGRLVAIAEAGHLPHMEQPEQVLQHIDTFASSLGHQ